MGILPIYGRWADALVEHKLANSINLEGDEIKGGRSRNGAPASETSSDHKRGTAATAASSGHRASSGFAALPRRPSLGRPSVRWATLPASKQADSAPNRPPSSLALVKRQQTSSLAPDDLPLGFMKQQRSGPQAMRVPYEAFAGEPDLRAVHKCVLRSVHTPLCVPPPTHPSLSFRSLSQMHCAQTLHSEPLTERTLLCVCVCVCVCVYVRVCACALTGMVPRSNSSSTPPRGPTSTHALALRSARMISSAHAAMISSAHAA